MMRVVPYRWQITAEELEAFQRAMADVPAQPRGTMAEPEEIFAIGRSRDNHYVAYFTRWPYSDQSLVASTREELIRLMRLYMVDPQNSAFEEVNKAFYIVDCRYHHPTLAAHCAALVDLRQVPNGLCPRHQPQGD